MGNVITPYSPVPEVRPQMEPTPYQHLDVNPDQFGAGIGRAIQQAGQVGMEFAEKQQNYTNELYANDAATKGMRSLNDAWDDYGNNRGRAAHDALPGFQDRIEKIYHDTLDDAPNDQAKSLLSKSMRYMADSYLRNGQSHATSQLNQWRDQSTKDHATELMNQAALAVNDPPRMKGFIEAGAEEWRNWSREHSLDADSTDSTVRKYKGQAYHSIIAERIASGDLKSAQQIFADHAEEMDAGSRVTVERLMNPVIKTQRLNAVIDHLLGGAELPEEGASSENRSFTGYARGQGLPKANAGRFEGAGTGPAAAEKYGITPVYNQASHLGLDGSDLTTVRTGSGAKFSVAAPAASQIQGFLNELEETGYHIDPKASGGFADRNIRGTSHKSQHAYGAAIDVNWNENQFDGKGTNNLPPNVGQIADKWGLSWGGYFKGDKKDTMHFEVARLLGKDQVAGVKAPSQAASIEGGLPDKNTTFAKAAELTKDDPQLQHQVFTELGRRYHDFQTANAMETQQIKIGMPQLIEAAKSGAYDGDMPIPEDRIRALIPGVQGEKMIRDFKFAQFEGGLMKEAQFATPEAIGDMERDVFEGTGSLTMRLKAHRGMASTGGGVTGADAEADNLDFAKERQGLALRFEKFKQERQKLLTGPDADPAAYASTNPEVKAASSAYTQAYQAASGKPPSSPEGMAAQSAWQDYATKSLALQASLGIPEEGRHLMPRGQAIDAVSQLSKPGADAKSILDGMSQHYGASWPTILKDMSMLGNMPPAYQSLQVLDPQNASQLSQFLQTNVHPKIQGDKTVGPDKGISETMDQALTPKVTKTVRDTIAGDSNIQKMLQAYDRAGGSLDFNAKLLQSIHFLAYAKLMNGTAGDPGTAAGDAARAFTKNLEFLDEHGGAMVPAERIHDVRVNIGAKQNSLTPETVAGPEVYQRLGIRTPFADIGEGGVVGTAHLSDWLNRVKANPRWINNPDHSGVWLTDAGVTGGTGRVVRDKDGKPVEVKFSDVAPESPPFPPQGEMAGR